LAAYDTDSVDPLDRGSGRLIFHAEVRHEAARVKRKSPHGGGVRGNPTMSAAVPAAMTVAT
jgi:hypothetical protein